MKWTKLGRIFDPENKPWITSHAQVPTPIVLEDRIRVYYAARNQIGRALPYYFDVALEDPTRILFEATEPVLGFGAPGTFDEDGVMPGFALLRKGHVYLYYSGWNQKVSTPYHNATGLAVSTDSGKSFERCFQGPILDRTLHEPYLAVTPTIVIIESTWHMWYISGLRWENIDGKFEPVYVIKYARSYDGIVWERFPTPCIPQRFSNEAFSHPTVIYDGTFHMWFCRRGSKDYRDGANSYRLSYARSLDGRSWDEMPIPDLNPSPSGWDSSMVCYPSVVQHHDSLFMFYNGNGFGKSGIGVARAALNF